MATKTIFFLLMIFLVTGSGVLGCKHQPKKKPPVKDISRVVKVTAGNTTRFRNEELKSDFKYFKIIPLADTIRLDINGDGTVDKIFFSQSQVRKMAIYDGRSNKTTTIGTDKSFAGMADNLDWVDFWGILNDKQTYEVIIKDSEITGGRNVKLQGPSIFIRKDEVGGGVITFKKGRYIWVHQSD